jgi:hypothetical protein
MNYLKKKKNILTVLKGSLYNVKMLSAFLLDIKKIFSDNSIFNLFFLFLKNCFLNKNFLREHISLYINLQNISKIYFDKIITGLITKSSFILKKHKLHLTYRRYLNEFLVILDGRKESKIYSLFFFKLLFGYLKSYFSVNFLSLVLLPRSVNRTFSYSFFRAYLNLSKGRLSVYVLRYTWLKFFLSKNIVKLCDNKLLINYNINLLSFSLFDIFNYYDYILNKLALYTRSRSSLNEMFYILKKSCFLTMRLKLKYYGKFFTYKLFNEFFSFSGLILKKTELKKYITYKY